MQHLLLWLSTSLRHLSSPTRRRLRWSGGLDPGSVRRRRVVKAPPVVDSGAVERAEPAGFVSAEPVVPAVDPAHDDEAAPSIRVSPPQAHDPVQAMMDGYRDLDPRTRALLRQAFSRYTQGSPP